MIARDVARCYQGDWQVDQLRLRMASVLRGCAPEMGYTQGMCFLAVVGPEHFERRLGSLRELWAPDFPWIQRGIDIVQEMMQEVDPELSHHLFRTLGAVLMRRCI